MLVVSLFLVIVSPLAVLSVQSSHKIGGADVDTGEWDEAVPVHDPACKLPKERGQNCPNKGSAPEVKWYFDTATLQCLAFGYRGCGGNANRFDSVFECKSQCRLPADYGGCSGKSAAVDAKGKTITCGRPPAPSHGAAEECPPGYRCQMMAFFGLCCHAATQDMYARNYRPTCANGKKPHQLFDAVNSWPVAYLGKRCADEFCPPGGNMTCHEQEIFAHCCPK